MPAKKKQSKLSKFVSALNPTTPFKKFLLFVVAFAVVGGGYYLYKSHAQTYTYLFTNKSVSAWACKQYSSSYGGAYNVTVIFTKPASASPQYYEVWANRVSRGYVTTQPGGTSSNSYWGNTTGSGTVSFSTYYSDYGYVTIHDTSSRSSTGAIRGLGPVPNNAQYAFKWSSITNCSSGGAF